jgi:hypothetical protein
VEGDLDPDPDLDLDFDFDRMAPRGPLSTRTSGSCSGITTSKFGNML